MSRRRAEPIEQAGALERASLLERSPLRYCVPDGPVVPVQTLLARSMSGNVCRGSISIAVTVAAFAGMLLAAIRWARASPPESAHARHDAARPNAC